MGLQARMSPNDERLYNVGRDCAHNFGDVCREAARRLEDQKWPFLRRYCETFEVTPDELGAACEAFLKFAATATDVFEERNPDQALARVGWFAVRDEAQFAFLAIMSTVHLGYYYVGVREATMGGAGPTLGYGDLVEAGRRTSRIITAPWWRRRLAVLRYRARLWLLRRLGAEPQVSPLMSHLDYDAKAQEAARQIQRAAAARTAAGPPRTTDRANHQAP